MSGIRSAIYRDNGRAIFRRVTMNQPMCDHLHTAVTGRQN
jgi:hypothetical protein